MSHKSKLPRFDYKIISTSYVFCLFTVCSIEINDQVCIFRLFSLSHIVALISLGVLKGENLKEWGFNCPAEANVYFHSERCAKQCTSATQVCTRVLLLQPSACLVLWLESKLGAVVFPSRLKEGTIQCSFV